jgi:Ca2+/Na+ antiporter
MESYISLMYCVGSLLLNIVVVRIIDAIAYADLYLMLHSILLHKCHSLFNYWSTLRLFLAWN